MVRFLTINISRRCLKQSLSTKPRTQTNHALFAVFFSRAWQASCWSCIFLEFWLVPWNERICSDWPQKAKRKSLVLVLRYQETLLTIYETFLPELPRFQSKPLPSIPSANFAAIKPGYIFLEVSGRMLSTNPTEQKRTISEDTRDKLFPQNLLSHYRCRSIFWTWPPMDPKWENKVSENFLLGSFSNEDVKTAIRSLRTTTTLHMYHSFFVNFFAVTTRLRRDTT